MTLFTVDPPSINKTAVEYLDILRSKLDVGVKCAGKNASKAEANYTGQFNKHSKDKSFDVGDLVLVLLPSSTNKLMSQWQGPATITAQLAPHTYRIALDTGAVRVLHANHLRKFVTHVQSVGIVFEDDDNFGYIEPCPVKLDHTCDLLTQLDCSHLSDVQRDELC